jgi:tetratricopeptide (TPR) repeat protein
MSPGSVLRVSKKLFARQQFDDADEILQRGLKAFPDNRDLIVQYAFSAHNSRRYSEAIVRWGRVRERWPDVAMAWCGIAANARETLKIDEAFSTITEAQRRFPDDLLVVNEAARVANIRGAHAEAMMLWKRMLVKRPKHPESLQGHVNSLMMLGRFDEAAAELDLASSLFPDDRGLIATKGMLAMAREDWDGAIAFWRDFRVKYPDDKSGWECLGRAMAARQMVEIDKGLVISELTSPQHVARIENDEIRTMLLGFESIGDDCEFGMVQRRYGAEPLGLLRWNSVSTEGLLAAFANRFDGIGNPDRTEIIPSGNGEYYIHDKHWGFPLHTFLFTTQVDAATLFPKMCRRIAYLKDKFLADLQAAEKIFVYKSQEIRLNDLKILHANMRTFGPVRLLCVKQANNDALLKPLCGKPGEVFDIAKDLYIGFIDHLGNIDGYWDIAFDDWISICRGINGAPALSS